MARRECRRRRPPFQYRLITGGRSNLTFAVTDAAGRRFVLRRPPMGPILATAHDVAREYRLVKALGGTPVPVPRALAVCEDPGVNGTSFAVTAFVDGIVLDLDNPATALDDAGRRELAFHLVDVLADLHAVDLDAVGLADLSRRDGYIERQLRRWSRQWADSPTHESPLIDEVERRLRERVPAQRETTLVHGDYRFGNCIVDLGEPSRGGRARLGAVHARRPAGRPRPSRRLLARSRAGRARSRTIRRPPAASRRSTTCYNATPRARAAT